MAEQQIRFEDGASYERMMGVWSRLAGDVFLDWLAPPTGLRWIDIGCGNGAFTELLVERCAPSEVQGIDPSPAQLAFARTRGGARGAEFRQGDAMALPFANSAFDAAVMALVIFFIPDPAKGVAEMVRVIRPGGTAAAYAWDILGGGLPIAPIEVGMRAMGLTPLHPPRSEISQLEALRQLWQDAGLQDVETKVIAVKRTFTDFEDYWTNSLLIPSLGPIIGALAPSELERLKSSVRALLPADAAGRIVHEARANAVKGILPK